MATAIPRNAAGFSLAEVVFATRGDLHVGAPGARVCGVSTDSRTVSHGDLFVALVGERFDGHTHVAAAVERGAAAVLVSKEVEVPAAVGIVRVEDTLVALGDLARAHRLRWSNGAGPRGARLVVGITGSAGKTTTRSAIAGAMAALGSATLASLGNLNNEIGVPMTILQLTGEHTTAVIEMGMNRPGEIARVASVAMPDIAVLTLVAEAHTEGVGSIWGVAREKSEIFAVLPRYGVAIANGDDDLARAALVRAGRSRRVTYGESAGADVRLLGRVARGLAGSDLSIAIASRGEAPVRVEVTIPLLGVAGTYAALASAAVLSSLEARGDAAWYERALGAIGANESGRLQARERADGTIVIDDAYNANPASMAASISTAAEIATSLDRRLVLVLGPMFELGARAIELHEEVGRVAAARAPALVVTVGAAADPIASGAERAGARVARTASVDAALEALTQQITPRDVVLVKASNSSGLSRVAAKLMDLS